MQYNFLWHFEDQHFFHMTINNFLMSKIKMKCSFTELMTMEIRNGKTYKIHSERCVLRFDSVKKMLEELCGVREMLKKEA